MEQDEYLRRADGSIYGMREPVKPAEPTEDYKVADANLDTLPYADYDGTGCRYIDLGPAVYALVDWDGTYRVGLYFNLPDQDEGGICAEFERFSDCEAFCLRLSAAHAPLTDRGRAQARLAACEAHQINEMDNNWCRTCDTGECPDCGKPTLYSDSENGYQHIDPSAPGCFMIATHGAE